MVDTIDFGPASSPTFSLHEAMLSKLPFKSCTCFPCVVMRNLARDVVQDVRFGDTMSSMSTDPTHDRTEVTQQVAVESGQSTTDESKFRSTIVRQVSISVL